MLYLTDSFKCCFPRGNDKQAFRMWLSIPKIFFLRTETNKLLETLIIEAHSVCICCFSYVVIYSRVLFHI